MRVRTRVLCVVCLVFVSREGLRGDEAWYRGNVRVSWGAWRQGENDDDNEGTACVGVCLARDFLCVWCEGVLFFAALWGVCGMEAAHGSEQWDAPCCKHAR